MVKAHYLGVKKIHVLLHIFLRNNGVAGLTMKMSIFFASWHYFAALESISTISQKRASRRMSAYLLTCPVISRTHDAVHGIGSFGNLSQAIAAAHRVRIFHRRNLQLSKGLAFFLRRFN